jgi:outer membrane receptor protein involved in Fe transport
MALNSTTGRSRHSGLKARRRAGAALVALLTGAAPIAVAWPADAWAQADEAIRFDIPPQPIASALVAFARQAHVELVMSEEPSGGVTANAVHGVLNREQALAMLLDGTGYEARLDGGSLRLRRASARASGDQQRGAWDDNNGDLVQLAQAEGVRTTANDGVDPRPRQYALNEYEGDGDTVTVVGTNIRGAHPVGAPVDVYSSEDIVRMGATTAEEFIARLPQNFTSAVNTAPPGAASPNNVDGVASPDLRGLGPGTTLTLLNGRRLALGGFGRAADVSLIPASAIARVEVLTDGASAIYGSDAIGGVVNFVLRDDFDGAETQVGYSGVTDGHLRRGHLTQTFGRAWTAGRALLSLTGDTASALETSDRSYTLQGLGISNLTPVDQGYGALGSFSQDLGQSLTLSADIAYSERSNKNAFNPSTAAADGNFAVYSADTRQAYVNIGLDYAINDKLDLSLTATHADRDSNVHTLVVLDLGTLTVISDRNRDYNYKLTDVTASLNGRLFSLPAGDIRFAAGVDYLDEAYFALRSPTGAAVSNRDLGRATSSAFAEVIVPLANPAQGIPLVHRLDASIAGRYTDYQDTSSPSLNQDFGDGFSPKFTFSWMPISSLELRGTWGESFRAPSLQELDPTGTQVSVTNRTISGATVQGFNTSGPIASMDAETATSYTVGFDYRPSRLPGFRLGVTYWNIDYVDRIRTPSITQALANPAAFSELVYRPSSAGQLEDILSASATFSESLTGSFPPLSDPAALAQALIALPDLWVVDQRTRNLASSTMDGIDISITDRIDMQHGEVSFGANLTHYLSSVEQATVSSPTVTTVDIALRPADLKANVYVGYSTGALQTQLNVRYVDDYQNRYGTGGTQANVASWTTLDWTLGYDFGVQRAGGALSGVRVNLAVANLLDQDPPTFLTTVGGTGGSNLVFRTGYDVFNADPIGRLVSLTLTKSW